MENEKAINQDSEKCIPCCNFCKNADPCEHDKDGCVIDEYVVCYIKNEKVWIGGECDKFECRYCNKPLTPKKLDKMFEAKGKAKLKR